MQFDKAKISFFFGLFMMLISGVSLLLYAFTSTDIPTLQALQTSTGVVRNLEYNNRNRGPAELTIITDKFPNKFFLSTAGYLKNFSGCRIRDINIGDKIKIYYDSDGYDFSFGEQNAIWKIEKNKMEILSPEDVKTSLERLNKYYGITGIAVFVLSLLFTLSTKFFPNLFW